MRPILVLALFCLSTVCSYPDSSRSLRIKRHYGGCTQSCGQSCNSCNQASCSSSCQSCITQNCCSNCCVNQCNVCNTQSCQSNSQCNQCCNRHCAPIPQLPTQASQVTTQYQHPQASNQSSQTISRTDSGLNTTVNITNIVLNRNNVSIPITITNTNHVTASLAENSTSESQSGRIITQRESEKIQESSRPYLVPYPVRQPVPYSVPVHVPYPIRIPVYIPVQNNVPVPVPVHHRVPIPVPVHHQIPVPVPVPYHHQVHVPIPIHQQIPWYAPVNIPVSIPHPINTHPCYGVRCVQTREYFNRKICDTNPGQNCRIVKQNCVGCNATFYENLDTYRKCYGCFL